MDTRFCILPLKNSVDNQYFTRIYMFSRLKIRKSNLSCAFENSPLPIDFADITREKSNSAGKYPETLMKFKAKKTASAIDNPIRLWRNWHGRQLLKKSTSFFQDDSAKW